jgi:cytochrome c oxidase subunit 3
MTFAAAATLPYSVENRLPGNRGIWVGIFSEMTEFALLFAVYFIARAHHPEAFREGPGQLHTLAGMLNTVLMITGSYFVAKAVLAIRRNQRALCTRWLVGVGFTIAGYLLTKYFEIQWNIEHGIVGNTGIFYTVYYYLTFTHAVHIIWGAMGLVWVLFRTQTGAYTPENHEGLEAYALYWHATDLAWLIIFPLVYVLR